MPAQITSSGAAQPSTLASHLAPIGGYGRPGSLDSSPDAEGGGHRALLDGELLSQDVCVPAVLG